MWLCIISNAVEAVAAPLIVGPHEKLLSPVVVRCEVNSLSCTPPTRSRPNPQVTAHLTLINLENEPVYFNEGVLTEMLFWIRLEDSNGELWQIARKARTVDADFFPQTTVYNIKLPAEGRLEVDVKITTEFPEIVLINEKRIRPDDRPKPPKEMDASRLHTMPVTRGKTPKSGWLLIDVYSKCSIRRDD
jgi:hypothetical protein